MVSHLKLVLKQRYKGTRKWPIDNIFRNDLKNLSVSGLMFCDISDHLPIFTLLLDQSKNLFETSWISFRDKSANNSLRLQIGLQTLIGMNCLNIKILTALIGIFLINTQPFTTTAFLLKK